MSLSAALLLITIIWESTFRYLLPMGHNLINEMGKLLVSIDSRLMIRDTTGWEIFLFLWAVSYCTTIILLVNKINHIPRLEERINRTIEYIAVLAIIYLGLDLISLLVVLVGILS